MEEIRIKCPYCDVLLEVPQNLSGENIECPDCDELLEVPYLPEETSKQKKKLSMKGRRKRRITANESESDGESRKPNRTGKSPFPTTLGVIYFVYGLIACTIIPAACILLYVFFKEEHPDWNSEQSTVALILLLISVLIPLLISMVYFICGFGLIKRKTWAYKLNILITVIGTFHLMPFALFGYLFILNEFKREFKKT